MNLSPNKTQYVKHFDRGSQTYIYFNKKSGRWSYEKPRLLRECEDIDEPNDEWLDSTDDNGYVYYFNPRRGMSSWINEEQVNLAKISHEN